MTSFRRRLSKITTDLRKVIRDLWHKVSPVLENITKVLECYSAIKGALWPFHKPQASFFWTSIRWMFGWIIFIITSFFDYTN